MIAKYKIIKRRATRIRVVGWLCLFLGVVWTLSPLLHGVFHFAEIAHSHPSGSVHRHGDGLVPGHGHSHGSHSHGSEADFPHSHQESKEDSGEEQESGRPNRKVPQSPAEDFPAFVFSTLELAAIDVILTDVELSGTSSLENEVVKSVCFDASIIVGAAGPRGPPA